MRGDVSGNDAINEDLMLVNNYSDDYRGEIILDDNDNCWIATTTKSTNFPIVNGVQNNNAGDQDAVVFKLNNSLTNLMWSSYFGGIGPDAAYSIQLNSQGKPVISGGTYLSSLNTSINALNATSLGSVDGFVAILCRCV